MPAVTHDGVQALGQPGDEVPDLRVAQRAHHLGLGRVGLGVGQVGPHGVVEEVGLLGHHADAGVQGLLGQVADVDPADAHGSAG